jgi:membrane protease YdiL (CAAX protease family)
MGSLLAILYEKKGSLFYPVVAHSILCIPAFLSPLIR